MRFRVSEFRRTALACGLAVCALAAGAVPAFASGGPVAADGYGFVAKLEIGVAGTADSRGCSGALVRPRVVVTAASCLVSVAHPDPAASAALPVTVRFGDGSSVRAVDVRKDVAPGVSAVVLAKPMQVAVAKLATGAAADGDKLTAAGFGRTKTAWVVDKPHTVAFTVQQADADKLSIALDENAETGLCKGDAGAPLTRELADGKPELVALAATAYQKGCLSATDTSGDATGVSAISLAALPAATTDLFDQLTLSPTDSGRAPIAGEAFGGAVVTADFNKDGYLDVAVGAQYDKTGPNRDVQSGTVTIFSGGANGPGTGRVLSQTEFNAYDEAGDRFGAALATGDFNKDGYADLAIGTPGEAVGDIVGGAIAVFYGSATGLGSARGFNLGEIGQTVVAGDGFGSALAAGDFNGDGYADLAIGAPGKAIGTAKSGEVFVLKGAATGIPKAAGWVVDQRATAGSNEAGDLFGASLAAGNVVGAKTGTVYADLVVGVPGEAPGTNPKGGMATVIPGSANGPVSGGMSFDQSTSGGAVEDGDLFGATVATGDFDKDGWADIAVGVPGEAAGTLPKSGTMAVYPGGNTFSGKGYAVEQRDFVGGANELGDDFGTSFAVGDINGDGYADLLAGAPGKAGGAGVIYTMFGGAYNATTRPETLVPGLMITQQDIYGTAEAGDRFGAAVALGDLNKDGKADGVVGSPGESAPGEPNAGTTTTLSRLNSAK